MQQITLAGGGTRGFVYDAAGNVVQDNRTGGGFAYSYDAAGRMAELRVGGALQASYLYDAMGRQVVRNLASGQVIHSVYDSQGRRIAEYSETPGALLREYVWLGWEPIAVIEGGVVHFVRTDHIGRPVFATNASGSVVWTAKYDPFGNVHAATGTPATIRFPGQWFQSESGLHQNWMRDYDPTTGRYLQADPLGLIDGASVYGYVGQNPMHWIDLTGEERKTGRTPPKSWPDLPSDLAGKKPKWNPKGYWEGKNGKRLTWDDRSHGTGQDRGNGPQGGHWDDEKTGGRWRPDGSPLPGNRRTPAESSCSECQQETSGGGGGGVFLIIGGVFGAGVVGMYCVPTPVLQ